MMAFGHTAIGATVGLVSYQYLGQSPILGLTTAFSAGIISHYIFDFIPHGHFFNLKKFKKLIMLDIIFDLFLSVALFLFVIYFKEGFSIKFFFCLFGIAGAQLPDIIQGLQFLNYFGNKGIIKTMFSLHRFVHWHGDLDKALPWGKRDIWQVSTFALALYLTFFIF